MSQRQTVCLQAGRGDDEDAEDAARAAAGSSGVVSDDGDTGSAPGSGRSNAEEQAGGEERGQPLELFGADNPDRTDMPGGPNSQGLQSDWEGGDPEESPESDWEADPEGPLEGGDQALEALGEPGEGKGAGDAEDELYAGEVRRPAGGQPTWRAGKAH